MEHSNVLLVLMCLDLKDPNPLRSRSGQQAFLEDDDSRYQLLVAVLDPAQRSTSAPVMGIKLNEKKRGTYNSIIRQFQEISARFYGEDGFIKEPTAYTDAMQKDVMRAMSSAGRDIYDLFQTGDEVPYLRLAIRDWLDRLLGSTDSVRTRQRPIKPVTVLTNDFGIPWFWLKRERTGPFLCEVCSLGLLQLSAVDRATGEQQAPAGQRDKTYEALLIQGSNKLPLLDEELDMIAGLLSDPDRGAARSFTAQKAHAPGDIYGLQGRGELSLLDDFRIVHFSGHYSAQTLDVAEGPVAISALYPVLNGALLVLDGSSSGDKPDAWGDTERLTSSLINKGALGCIVTALPIKHDPIVSKVLWGSFYRELRRGASTVGQALAKARLELRDHFVATGSGNPAWALYQLIGSPAVQLCDEEDEADG
jgi:hypothetical protein